jgi:hypothetical protein
MTSKTNPSAGGAGARNFDLPGRAIASEINKLSPSEFQVAHLISRFKLTPPRAALVARLAFGEAANG